MTVKIGVISDTHSAGSGRDLPSKILDALSGVDLILHCIKLYSNAEAFPTMKPMVGGGNIGLNLARASSIRATSEPRAHARY